MNDWPPMTLELIEICQELDCMTKAWDEASLHRGRNTMANSNEAVYRDTYRQVDSSGLPASLLQTCIW